MYDIYFVYCCVLSADKVLEEVTDDDIPLSLVGRIKDEKYNY